MLFHKETLGKSKIINSVITQLLLIIVAFSLMGVLSYIFIGDIEKKHLIQATENALSIAELKIDSLFYEEDGVLNIEADKVLTVFKSISITPNSYGILLNENLEIIVHPLSTFRNSNLAKINSGIAHLAPELEKGLDIKERRIKNYAQTDSVAFFKKIENGWYLGYIIPVFEYYKIITNLAVFLFIIGAILTSILCIILFYLHKAKALSDLRIQQKSNFLATISHEIRTPLNTILGMTEIQMQNTTHPPSTSEVFIKINNSGNILLNIINDILDLSKIESGSLNLVLEKYEVINLITDIVHLNNVRYQNKPIDFSLEVDENVPTVLIGDVLRIKQILNNILSNAFKYTESGKVIFSVNAECISRGGIVQATLVFMITDTGIGMTPKQIKLIFDDDVGFHMEANRTTEGAGLGITITRNLLKMMNGTINIKSNIDEGTTVTIKIPQKTESLGIKNTIGKEIAESLRQFKNENYLQMKKSSFLHEYMPYGKVLIVDDVETNLHVAKGLMVPYGLEIELAKSGFEALDKIKSGKMYDIIFMDHMMPRMDGIETTRQIRNSGYTKPIVALTANALVGQAEIFIKNGFDDFVSKPIDVRQLNNILNKLIRDRQSYEVINAAKKQKELQLKNSNTQYVQSNIDSQLAVIFTRDAEKAVTSLKSCLKNNLENKEDITLYIINVHAMKSALANIGENDLSAFALRLERAGRDNNITVMIKETPVFLEKLNKIIENIKPKNTDETNEDTEENLTILQENLNIIKNACYTYDKKTAKNALNQLIKINWSVKNNEFLNKISVKLLHSEFDDAVKLIENHFEDHLKK